jgi:hypothetical protein
MLLLWHIFLEICVITNEEEIELPPPKKPKKNYDIIKVSKCVGNSIPMGKDVEK